MWVDGRGSQILPEAECLRLLALAARRGAHARIGYSTAGAPVVVPVDFAVDGRDLLIRIGRGFMSSSVPGALVAIEVDEVGADGEAWSVLVRGLAQHLEGADRERLASRLPVPRVAEPGDVALRIRGDVVSGRRFSVSHAADHR